MTWERNGFGACKRLERGHFIWLRAEDAAMEWTLLQLQWLLSLGWMWPHCVIVNAYGIGARVNVKINASVILRADRWCDRIRAWILRRHQIFKAQRVKNL